MKIIFLNCWQGKLSTNLDTFLQNESKNTDAFLFQESDLKSVDNFKKILPKYNFIFFEKDYINTWKFEQSTFLNENIIVVDKSFNSEINTIGGILTTKLKVKNFEVLLINVHGVSMPGDKKDNQDRLTQSKAIIETANKYQLPTIIGGDFNLNPDTKSISIFEESGFVNLIKKFSIEKTRNRYAWEQAERQQGEQGLSYFGQQYFADYCFVSKDIKVKNFSVPDIEVSDHLPLILEFTPTPITI